MKRTEGALRRIVTKTNTSFYGCNNYDKGCCFTIPAVIAGKRLNAVLFGSYANTRAPLSSPVFTVKPVASLPPVCAWMTRCASCSTSPPPRGREVRNSAAKSAYPRPAFVSALLCRFPQSDSAL